jgi:hypothetical protein
MKEQRKSGASSFLFFFSFFNSVMAQEATIEKLQERTPTEKLQERTPTYFFYRNRADKLGRLNSVDRTKPDRS